jgi:signal recognition particle subunit SRP72
MVRDDYTEADIEQELAIIVVQLAYVYQLQGKTEQAIELYQSITKSRYKKLNRVSVDVFHSY